MITIIDYKSGNLRSISNSFKKIGVEAIITSDPTEIANAKHLVLPGVGAFGTAMENIEPFKDVIFEHIDDGKPFLGICLGLQVLFLKRALFLMFFVIQAISLFSQLLVLFDHYDSVRKNSHY